MIGNQFGSDIKYFVFGSDFFVLWFNDCNIQCFNINYVGKVVQIVFKVEYIGGYDDFYYIIY